MKRWSALCLLVFAAACDTTIDAAFYDADCTTPDDCVAVFTGDVCADCTCANSAISVAEEERYNADRAAISCPPDLLGPTVQCECAAPILACVNNICVLDN